MKTKFCKLPDWDFVGGSTEVRRFEMAKDDGTLFNLIGGIGEIAIVPFVNSHSEPVLVKSVQVVSDESGVDGIIEVTLDSADTLDLDGKYYYQLSIKNTTGNAIIPSRGVMNITGNLHKEFLS